MKKPIDIDRLAAKAGVHSVNSAILERRAIIDKLNVHFNTSLGNSKAEIGIY